MAIDRFVGEYKFLSNFYPAPVTIIGIEFPTTEHAYQACKTLDLEWVAKIQRCTTPGSAKRMGRKAPMRKDWKLVKDSMMLLCLRAKFINHPHLATWLLATGDQQLIEGNLHGDTYWGIYNGRGLNRLGDLLMRVRKELK